MSDFKQMMLEFAQAGFYVFPKLRRFKKGENKAGMPPGWNHNSENSQWHSSNDIDTVLEWCNLEDIIGYGVNRREDCFVIDVDCGVGKANAQDALNSLNSLKTDFNLPKPSMVTRTKSGGYHYYYAHPGIPIKMVIGVMPGIDLPIHVAGPEYKGTWQSGSYVLIRGRPSNSLQPISNKLTRWLDKNHTKKFIDTTISLVDPNEKPGDNLQSGEIPEVVGQGERHMIALRLIAIWVRGGIPRGNILALLNVLDQRCEGGLPNGVQSYVERVDDTLSKPNFSRKTPEPLEFFMKNAIYVRRQDGVFEIPTRNVYIQGLNNVYAHLHWWVDPPEGSNAKPKKVYAYKEWLERSDKQTVESIGYKPVPHATFYDPTQKCEVANTYIAPNHCTPLEGSESWDIFEKFVRYLGRNKWVKLMEWIAWQIKFPHLKLQIAVALISETRGVGKNLLINILERCIGIDNAVELSLDKLLEKHNDYPMRSHLVVVNETHDDMSDGMNSRERNKAINEVKDMITNSSVSVNPKFIRVTSVTSYVNYVFTSNSMSAIPMESSDRRFEVFVCPEEKLSVEEYTDLWNLTEAEISTIYHKLKTMHIATITDKYSAVKADEDKQMAILAGKNRFDVAIFEAIRDKQSVFTEDLVIYEQFAWFVLTHVGMATQDYVFNLFKMYCKPVYRKTSKQARGISIETPNLDFKGNDFRPGTKGVRNLHCCRNSNSYNNDSVRLSVPTAKFAEICRRNNFFIDTVEASQESFEAKYGVTRSSII